MNGDRRQQIVDQVAYLLEEAAALKRALRSIPEEVLQAQPIPGEPSVRDLFEELASREAGPRIRNVKRLLGGDDNAVLESTALASDASAKRSRTTYEALDEVVSARSEILSLITGCPPSAWTTAASLDGEEVTLERYLFGMIQEDVAILQTAAIRIHESRPTRSPGFTSR